MNLPTEKLPRFLTDPDPSLYVQGNALFVDFETTNVHKGNALIPENSIVLACWAENWGEVKHCWGGEHNQAELVAAIERADFIVAHNAKFEIHWLIRCGVDPSKILCFDTMIADYVLGGNKYRMSDLSLNSCAKRHGLGSKDDVVSTMIKNGVCPSEIPQSWLLKYCIQDVALARRLFHSQVKRLEEEGKLHIQYARCLVTPVLADIEHNGMCLDPEIVLPSVEKKEREFNSLHEQLQRMCPTGYSTDSAQQLQYILYEHFGIPELQFRGNPIRTPKGQPKTDIQTVQSLVPKNKTQKQFLELYIKVNDLRQELTKYLRKFKECCEKDGGILSAHFNQTVTQTHRLSSTGTKYRTQLQNLPRAYKGYFKARHEGWVAGEGDESQLEFRAAGHLARDPVIVKSIVDGEDIHAYTASVLTDAGQPTGRQDAKPHTFKPLYGGKSGTDAERTYYAAFRTKYSSTTGWQEENINTVLKTGKLRTEYGLEFFWPNTRREPSGYITNSTAICNYPVQGFATAEIVPLALVWMWHYIKVMGLRMFITNTVHDSILAEIPPEEEATFHDLARVCLINRVYESIRRLYNIDLTIPLGCEVLTGTHWGDSLRETKYEAGDELWMKQ